MATALIAPLVSAGTGLLTGYFQRKAAKKAATEIANAYSTGIGRTEDTTNRSVDRVENAAGNAKSALAQQTNQAIDYTNQGLTDSNGKLQGLLDSEKGNLDPYLTAGKTGAERYTDLMTNPQTALENTPGYQFQLQQGLQGVQASSAAHGALQSGGTLKALETYGQGLAGTTYQQAIQNALAGSSQGLTASGQYNSGLQNLGGQQAANITNAASRNGELGVDWAKTSGNWDQNAAVNAGNFDMSGNNSIVNLLLGKAGVTAGGTLAATNATNSMIGAGASGLQALLQQLLGGGKKSSSSGGTPVYELPGIGGN